MLLEVIVVDGLVACLKPGIDFFAGVSEHLIRVVSEENFEGTPLRFAGDGFEKLSRNLKEIKR